MKKSRFLWIFENCDFYGVKRKSQNRNEPLNRNYIVLVFFFKIEKPILLNRK